MLKYFFVFDDLYFIDLVFLLAYYYLLFAFFLPALILIFVVLAKRLAEKSIFEMTYLVSSWASNLNSVRLVAVSTLLSIHVEQLVWWVGGLRCVCGRLVCLLTTVC